jgi:hypothetical protein
MKSTIAPFQAAGFSHITAWPPATDAQRTSGKRSRSRRERAGRMKISDSATRTRLGSVIAASRSQQGGRKHAAGPEAIDLGRIGEVLGADWGFCHTVERNLGGVADLWARKPLTDAPIDVGGQVAAVLAAIERAPKSFGWKTRARVGERVRWYETPEEVRH